jgi:hypothetical protein
MKEVLLFLLFVVCYSLECVGFMSVRDHLCVGGCGELSLCLVCVCDECVMS